MSKVKSHKEWIIDSLLYHWLHMYIQYDFPEKDNISYLLKTWSSVINYPDFPFKLQLARELFQAFYDRGIDHGDDRAFAKAHDMFIHDCPVSSELRDEIVDDIVNAFTKVKESSYIDKIKTAYLT